jgi:renalase
MAKIAIIGAGIAGLSCARVLADAGHDVAVFDKGRGPGGRMSTRRGATDMGDASFDHGAQYFTARDPGFVGVVQALVAAGAAGEWQGNLVRLAQDGTTKPLANEALYVGMPGMNGVVRALAQGLDVTWGLRVHALVKHDAHWQLLSDQGADLGHFDLIVCAVPAEQVPDLLEGHAPALVQMAQGVASLPCWTGMFAFDAPLSWPFDAARLERHPMIDFIAANHSKPGRAGPVSYVVQARADWSTAHLEESADSIATQLLEGLMEFIDNRPTVILSAAHRWRYAKVEVEHGPSFGLDADAGIGVCGDWLSGPRVESAWQSGCALGTQMTAALKRA